MKTLISSILLLTFSILCYSQNNGKENLNLVFYDNCFDRIIEPEFEVFSIEEFNYEYITVYKKTGDWILQYTTSLKTKNDTIRIPKILFAGGSELHSKRWTYLNCDKICNGTETDFYENGNIRLEGTFENGKPFEIREYWTNGNLHIQTFYENLTLNYKRVDYYNENGDLDEYQIYENKRRKTIIKTFDKNGRLIETETEKKYIERN